MMRTRAVSGGRMLLGALLLTAGACGGSAQRAPATGATMPPAMTIERFLSAANQNDLDTMASLFGTRDGPVTRNWTREEIDTRMFLFASVLRHTDYEITGQQIVPGRRDEATMFVVRMDISNQRYEVPFTLVRTVQADHWLIENIGLEQVTRSAGSD